MLKDDTAAYYFLHLCGKAEYTFQTLVQQIRALFETEDNRKTYLIHWQETTLPSIIQENPDKTKIQALRLLYQRLRTIQQALPAAYQTDTTIRDQLLHTCQGIQECQLALYNLAGTSVAVYNQLHTAISAAQQQLF